jgi:hypothetical protein
MTEEDKELYKKWAEEEKAIAQKWEDEKKSLSKILEPKYIKWIEQDAYWTTSLGVVEIEVLDEKDPSYPNSLICKVKDGSIMGKFMLTDGEVYDDEYKVEESLYYWVKQWNVGIEGDSYEGIALMPLKDGRFWAVQYSM